MISCWVPYWRSAQAIATVHDQIGLFNQVSPFSYEVQADGTLKDPFKKNTPLWDSLKEACLKRNILFVPTVTWTNTQEMHTLFSDKNKLTKHTDDLLDLVEKKQLDGININYERIHSQDRTAYISFLERLSKKLHRNKKVLHISIGGRTSDSKSGLSEPLLKQASSLFSFSLYKPEVSLSPGYGREARRYKKVIGECCDQVHIMGYDEWGTPHRSSHEHLKNEYYVSHSSNQWVEKIILYSLSYIPRHKLVLGVPTYGLEFAITNFNGTISFKKKRSLNFGTITELFTSQQKKPRRTAGGELSFTYNNGEEDRYVCYVDAQSIKEKIALVKKYGIKGINIFTVNGNEDSALWLTLEKELLLSSLK